MSIFNFEKSSDATDRFSYGTSMSIAGMARKNIFEFPVFISDTVDNNYASSTCTLLEQVYGSYLQSAISIKPIIDEDILASGNQFNAWKTDTNNYVEYTDMSYAHDVCHNVICNGDTIYEFDMVSISDKNASIINEYCNHVPLSEFNDFFQESKRGGHGAKDPKRSRRNDNDDENEYEYNNNDDNGNKEDEVNNNASPVVVKNATEPDDYNKESDEDREKRTKADEADARARYSDAKTDQMEASVEKLTNTLDRDKEKDEHMNQVKNDKLEEELVAAKLKTKLDQKSNRRFDNDKNIANAKLQSDTRLSKKRISSYNDEQRRARERHNYDTKIEAPKMLDEGKINKINELKPLMMNVNFKVKTHDGNVSAPIQFVIGVKTVARLVSAEVLPEMAEYPIKEMNKLTRHAKFKAGEIKLFEFLFKTKEKKQTAIDSMDHNRKWYRRLYELAHRKNDKLSAAFSNPSTKLHNIAENVKYAYGVMPNATLIISKADVSNIKMEKDIDLLDAKIAGKLCEELFLMSFIVIDVDGNEIDMLTPDLNNDFEIHSIASVEKQISSLNTLSLKTSELSKALGNK